MKTAVASVGRWIEREQERMMQPLIGSRCYLTVTRSQLAVAITMDQGFPKSRELRIHELELSRFRRRLWARDVGLGLGSLRAGEIC